MAKKTSLQNALNQLDHYVRVASSLMLKLRDNLLLNWKDHQRITDLIAQLGNSGGDQVAGMSDDDFKAAIYQITPDLLNRMILITDSNESRKKFIRKTELSPTYSLIVPEADQQFGDACFMYDRDLITVVMTPTTKLGVGLEAAKKGGIYTGVRAITEDVRIVKPLTNATVLDNQTGECMLSAELATAGDHAYLSNGGTSTPNPIEVSVDPSTIFAYDGTPSTFNPPYGRDKVFIHDRPYSDYHDDSGRRGCLVVPVEARQFVPVKIDMHENTNGDSKITSYCFIIYNDSDVRQCYCLTPTLQQENTYKYSMLAFRTSVAINEKKRETDLLCFQQLVSVNTAFRSPLKSVRIQGSKNDSWPRALLGALPIRSELRKLNFVDMTVS